MARLRCFEAQGYGNKLKTIHAVIFVPNTKQWIRKLNPRTRKIFFSFNHVLHFVVVKCSSECTILVNEKYMLH